MKDPKALVIPAGGVPILGGNKPAPTDDQKLLGALDTVLNFRNTIRSLIEIVKATILDVSLDPPTSDALHAYIKMLEEGYEVVQKQQATVLALSSKAFLQQFQRNVAKVQELIDSLPEPKEE